MNQHEIILQLENYVRNLHQGDSSGHDWHHIDRVRNLAVHIAKKENANQFIVECAALVHDVIDDKLHDDLEVQKIQLESILNELLNSNEDVKSILYIIENISYKGGNGVIPTSLEGKIVQDADRLDAIGAIGVARTFAYGGKKGRSMYNPEFKIRDNMTIEEYRSDKSSSLHHFYEKILKLKDLMNTKTALEMAEERHLFVEKFIDEFMKEWNFKI
ncbi:HD domain-containing protein [Gottfriedia acidiceleris]|uniref:HD domain-containing protein n=1 Tax=Gottfriedia acidiceleris TaxID=371036 RepID=A0ABY4JQE1_9BACI|nr:HD domain-containing protein [Gottfriedia acidiceleris]UPM56056.1 HD domain-containing protein [Gottfriedia acidiceleris]